MGIKITLDQCKAQNAFKVTFRCSTPTPGGGWCNHQGEVGLEEAIARWGAHTRLDKIPALCTRCGQRGNVDVRTRDRRRAGGHAQGPYVE